MNETTIVPCWLNLNAISDVAEIAERRALAVEGRALLAPLVAWARKAAALASPQLAGLDGETFATVAELIGLAELDDVGFLLELLASQVVDPADCGLTRETIERLRGEYGELCAFTETGDGQ